VAGAKVFEKYMFIEGCMDFVTIDSEIQENYRFMITHNIHGHLHGILSTFPWQAALLTICLLAV